MPKIFCPECGAKLTVPTSFRGTAVRCRECGESVPLPGRRKPASRLTLALMIGAGVLMALCFVALVVSSRLNRGRFRSSPAYLERVHPEPTMDLDATQLYQEFLDGPNEARRKYGGVALRLTGTVSYIRKQGDEIRFDGIDLPDGVFCGLAPKETAAGVQVGRKATVVGRVSKGSESGRVLLDDCRVER